MLSVQQEAGMGGQQQENSKEGETQKMKKKRKNRGILYALAGLLVAAGAMAGVTAKETASVYDAPDLHLTQGSEKYDLTEGITYDSGKYELAVKDTGDFDINITGEYQVSYTLTPKGAETTREEKGEGTVTEGTASKSTEGESTVQNGDATVTTQASEDNDVQTAVESAADKKSDSENKTETILFKRTVIVEAEVVDGYYL